MTTTVPADHEVRMFHVAAEPVVQRTPGGVILACFGVAGDDADAELTKILGDVDRELAKNGKAVLVDEQRELRIDSLFAPAQLTTVTVSSPVSWVFHEASVVSLMASPGRREAFFHFAHRVASHAPQAVYLVDPPIPTVLAFAQLMVGLGAELRLPDQGNGTDGNAELVIQIEVKRPDGIFVVLAGPPLELPARTYEPRELLALDGKTVATRAKELSLNDRPIALRSPRLRARMIELQERSDEGGMKQLIEELLMRGLPLFLHRDPNSNNLELRKFGEVGALPAYADAISLHWAAQDIGRPADSYIPGAVDVADLLNVAASGKLGLAIGTYRDRKTPIYAVVPPQLVAALAEQLRRGKAT